jgi:hypothetical protein
MSLHAEISIIDGMAAVRTNVAAEAAEEDEAQWEEQQAAEQSPAIECRRNLKGFATVSAGGPCDHNDRGGGGLVLDWLWSGLARRSLGTASYRDLSDLLNAAGGVRGEESVLREVEGGVHSHDALS